MRLHKNGEQIVSSDLDALLSVLLFVIHVHGAPVNGARTRNRLHQLYEVDPVSYVVKTLLEAVSDHAVRPQEKLALREVLGQLFKKRVHQNPKQLGQRSTGLFFQNLCQVHTEALRVQDHTSVQGQFERLFLIFNVNHPIFELLDPLNYAWLYLIAYIQDQVRVILNVIEAIFQQQRDPGLQAPVILHFSLLLRLIQSLGSWVHGQAESVRGPRPCIRVGLLARKHALPLHAHFCQLLLA